MNGVGGTAEAIAGTGIIASIYDFFIGVREGQFGGYQAHAIMDELQIKSGIVMVIYKTDYLMAH